MDQQTQQAVLGAAQTINAGLQALAVILGANPTQPGNIAGGLNGYFNGQTFPTIPVVAPPITYTAYVPPVADAYVVNADGVGRTAINPVLLSKPADVLRLMSSFTAAGYTVLGYSAVVNVNEVYPSDLKQYVISVKEHTSGAINVGQALFNEFRAGVDPSGNPHPGKWVLQDGAQNIFQYDNAAVVDPWSTKGLVVAL